MSAPEDHAEHGAWWVQSSGQAYGPYKAAHMARYVGEGRVKPSSQVAHSADGPWTEARDYPELMAHLKGARTLAVQAPPEGEKAPTANMLVYAEINSGAHGAFMAALAGMGLGVDLAPGVWLVRTRHTVGTVRNTLSQTLAIGDKFLVVDASRDRLAWHNLGPETDVRIKDVWNGALPQDQAR